MQRSLSNPRPLAHSILISPIKTKDVFKDVLGTYLKTSQGRLRDVPNFFVQTSLDVFLKVMLLLRTFRKCQWGESIQSKDDALGYVLYIALYVTLPNKINFFIFCIINFNLIVNDKNLIWNKIMNK